ncbi:hypothetical protein CPB85DRAFT_1438531 [Mucidula mucida]|nr:hypothetical protein CPB85DRAFT_1438531 [Mucidula mucida]
MSSDSSTWSCTINLRIEFGSDGQKLETLDPIVPFATVTNKDDVEIYLRRAQVPILSSTRHPTLFLKNYDLSRGEVTRCYRSGIGGFACADDKEVELIKGLVQDKIKNDKTIILVTIPMSEDTKAQRAVKLARLADPEGNRTNGMSRFHTWFINLRGVVGEDVNPLVR